MQVKSTVETSVFHETISLTKQRAERQFRSSWVPLSRILFVLNPCSTSASFKSVVFCNFQSFCILDARQSVLHIPLPVVSPSNTSGLMDQDGQGWLSETCVGRNCVAMKGGFSSYQIDLVIRFVPLSVFAEVARGVAGGDCRRDGWSGAVYVCLCVCVWCAYVCF